MPHKQRVVDAPQEQRPHRPHRHCCPPQMHVWVESRSVAIFVENRITEQRSFVATADVAVNQAMQPPFQVSDGASDSKLDVTTTKEQGKVYRTDSYTIHWHAEAEAHPSVVSLRVDGEVQYDSDCIPDEGAISLTRTHLLEPPGYQPTGPGYVSAMAEVVDCAGERAECSVRVPRP